MLIVEVLLFQIGFHYLRAENDQKKHQNDSHFRNYSYEMSDALN